jgi:hypothetical protein
MTLAKKLIIDSMKKATSMNEELLHFCLDSPNLQGAGS